MEIDQHHTFLTALPTFIVGLGMIAFLMISFILFHRRLSSKRKRDLENMRFYLNIHPGVTPEQYQIGDIPIRNNLKVMTNTHLVVIDELKLSLLSEHRSCTNLNKTRPIESKRKRQIKRKKNKPNVESFSQDNIVFDTDHYEKSEKNSANDRHKNVVKADLRSASITETNKGRELKGSRKKRRKFLKQLAWMSNSRNHSKESCVEPKQINYPVRYCDVLVKQSLSNSRHSTDTNVVLEGDAYEFKNVENSYEIIADKGQGNSYYEDIGLPVNQEDRPQSKRFRKAETIREQENFLMIKKPEDIAQNALFDRMTMKQKPKKLYKELVHRDSHGNISFSARTLPHLETEFITASAENSAKTNKIRSKSEMTLDKCDVLF